MANLIIDINFGEKAHAEIKFHGHLFVSNYAYKIYPNERGEACLNIVSTPVGLFDITVKCADVIINDEPLYVDDEPNNTAFYLLNNFSRTNFQVNNSR